ncbi:MAG: hypothetical protein ACXWUX_09485 [Allosphingosinicella sp.]
MVSALFTALALIAAGQAGPASSTPAATQARTSGVSQSQAPTRPSGRAAATAQRRHG